MNNYSHYKQTKFSTKTKIEKPGGGEKSRQILLKRQISKTKGYQKDAVKARKKIYQTTIKQNEDIIAIFISEKQAVRQKESLDLEKFTI